MTQQHIGRVRIVVQTLHPRSNVDHGVMVRRMSRLVTKSSSSQDGDSNMTENCVCSGCLHSERELLG